MPTSRGWTLFAALLLLGGCSKPSPSVYVNLQDILKVEGSQTPIAAIESKPPAPLRLAPFTLPPLSEEVIAPKLPKGGRSVEDQVRENRVKAYRNLESRLRDVYMGEVHRAEDAEIAKLSPAKTQAEVDAREKLRALFERYAWSRGPLVTQIALIAGFPDPDPNSKQQPVVDTALTRIRMNAAVRIRTQIAELDHNFDAEARKVFADLGRQSDIELTHLKANMEIARDAAERRAKADAAKQVRAIEASVGPALENQAPIVLAPVPGKAITGGNGSPPRAQAARVEAAHVLDDEGNRLQRLKDQLAIWLAVNGYRQASSQETGEDRTKEFIQWRNSRHLGP